MRIAFCLHGFAGGKNITSGLPVDFAPAYEHFREHIFNVNNVDVFIHAWNPELEKDLHALYRPVAASFEKMVMFDASPTKRHGIYSRWSSFKKAVELKRQHEEREGFKYDFVMVARFDLLFFRDVRFGDYDPKYFYVPRWDGDSREGVSDLWFFSNSRAMDRFATLFDVLDSYLPAVELSNHVLARHHLEKLGMLPSVKPLFKKPEDFTLTREYYRGTKKILIGAFRLALISLLGEERYVRMRERLR
ncbi:MAG: hypothetical protein V1885_01125 [Candidatus Brennerbacteria bacterium]